jgi:hypothetical protein
MTYPNSLFATTLLPGALLLGILVPTVALARPIDESAKLSEGARIDIENLAGSVTVEGWDRDEITVTGTLAEDAEELLFEAEGRRARIEVVYPSHGRNLDRTSSVLVVKVPRGSELRVGTVSADIGVAGIVGSLDLESVSGAVTIGGSPAEIAAETVSGRVEVRAECAHVEVASVSGRIVLEGPTGELSASTVSGDIESRGGTFESVQFSSVSGRIEFDGDPTETADFDFDCHSGSLVLVFPADLSAEIDVSTFSGSIENSFGPRPERTNDFAPGQELSFTVGSGDARISVDSFSGSVRMSLR